MVTRADIVRVARSYIETPFGHAQRKPGLGLDCVGVPICLARELGLAAPDFDVPPYMPTPDGHTMIEWCDAHLQRVERAVMQPGDMLIVVVDTDPGHIGILADYAHGGFAIIHASSSSHPPRVIETRLMFSRALRYMASYSLLEIR